MLPLRRDHASGFTLVELAAVMAITGIVLAVAVPSYSRFLQRQQLRGAADALMQDLRNARETSVRTRAPVFLNFRSSGKHWCWGANRSQPCDCSGASALPACGISQGHKRDYPDVRVDSAVDAEFEPALGQAPQHGAVAFSTAKNQSLRVELNAMGRAQVCGPDAVGAPPC
eukprot:Opistho-2@54534